MSASHEISRRVATSVAVVLVAAVGFALVAWSSLDDRLLLEVNPRPVPRLTPWTGVTEGPSGTPTSTRPAASAGHHWDASPWVGVVLGVFFVALFLTILAVILVHLARRLPRFAARPDDVDLGVAQPLLERTDAQRQQAILAEGSPRNGIVAAWLDLERTVAVAGFPRRPQETSSELVVRVLEDADVPGDALTRLNALYREARFSRHELTEAQRQEASEQLAAVHRALAGRAAHDAEPAGDAEAVAP